MITVMLLSCFAIIVSAVPVCPNVLQSRGGARRPQPVEVANQRPVAQTQPSVEQPQPGVPQPLAPQGGPQPLPSMPYYTWTPQGNRLMMIPLQLSLHGPQLGNQPTFPQGIFPSFGYLPMFPPPYGNQPPSSPYGFPVIPPQQAPANQPPEAALPAEPPQPVQQLQQQNPHMVYMLQQPMTSLLGTLSSEELEVAAKISQLGVYMPTMIANLPAGAAQRQAAPAAGLSNPGQAGAAPTAVAALAAQTQRLAGAGPAPDAKGDPAGLQREAQEVATAPTSVQPDLQRAQGHPV